MSNVNNFFLTKTTSTVAPQKSNKQTWMIVHQLQRFHKFSEIYHVKQINTWNNNNYYVH